MIQCALRTIKNTRSEQLFDIKRMIHTDVQTVIHCVVFDAEGHVHSRHNGQFKAREYVVM